MRGVGERGDGACIAVERGDPGALGEPQRKRPDAGEQVGDRFGFAGMLDHELRQDLLGLRRRLQERAGRERHGGAADADRRRCALRDELTMAGDPRQPVLVRHLRQRGGAT